MKQKDGFFINIGNRRSFQGMSFTKEELLAIAWEIKNITESKSN
jgi:hypothetical protein